MDMIKISAGKLRAIGYDAKTRTLRVELAGALLIQSNNVSMAEANVSIDLITPSMMKSSALP